MRGISLDMLIVLDTNVFVSAMLKRISKPAQILEAVLEGKFKIVVNEQIFEEYSEVLHRPKLKIPLEKANAILRFIAFSAEWVDTQPVQFNHELIQDLGDLPFAEAAICSGAEVIITGNLKHFGFLQNSSVKVLLPDEFIKSYPHFT
jgi:putative PIN family toxin of toxin-antitoxin system